jgi:hypothetical protein
MSADQGKSGANQRECTRTSAAFSAFAFVSVDSRLIFSDLRLSAGVCGYSGLSITIVDSRDHFFEFPTPAKRR